MDKVLHFFGSKSKVARTLGVSRPAVSYWIKWGLPPGRAIQIEILSQGELSAADIVSKSVGKENDIA
ncbi:MAG: helix-turn-helix domain-containing protein [Methyloprofundus sp.]|nr:helix-turn-helix domain-containing protein [Methyloprofundus sp.]